MDNNEKIVEYVVIIDKLNNSNSISYNYSYKTIETFSENNKYIYSNDLNIIDNIDNKELYILENNVIVYYLDETITRYLYDIILPNNIYNNIKDLNDTLKLNNINYEEINNIIQRNIQNALSYILTNINSKVHNNRFYFHLKYNKSTYYPYIDNIKEFIRSAVSNTFNFR